MEMLDDSRGGGTVPKACLGPAEMSLPLHHTHTVPARAASVAASMAELLSADRSMNYVSMTLLIYCCAT